MLNYRIVVRMNTTNVFNQTLCNGTLFNTTIYTNCTSFNSTNTTTVNKTTPEGPNPPMGPPVDLYPPLRESEAITAVVFFCIIIVFIVVGNLLVLISFSINRKLRTTTNTFIASLAAADLIVGALSVPLWCFFLLANVGLIPPELIPPEEWYQLWVKLDIFAGVSSVNHLTAISIERAYAMLFPLKHRRIRKRWIIIAVILAWTMGAGIAALHHLEWEQRYTYALMVTVGFYFFPLLVILASYAVIFKVARSSIVQHGRRTMKKDLKIATTIAMVIGIFVICWLPFHSMNLVLTLCKDCTFDSLRVIIIIKFGHYSNSGVNAIIYGFRNAEFNRTFKRIFLILMCKKVPNAYYQNSRSTMANTQSTMVPRSNVISRNEDFRESYVKAISKGVPSNKLKKSLLNQNRGHINGAVMMNDMSSSSPSEEKLHTRFLMAETLSDTEKEPNDT